MQKGQISIDLLLTLIIALILITSLGYLTNEIKNTHEENSTRNQLIVLTEKTASLINSTTVLNDTNYYIQFKIDRITYRDRNGDLQRIYPRPMLLDSNTILNFKMMVNGKTIDSNSKVYLPPETTIKLEDVQTNGWMVIKRA